jgi:hypothetical protein
MAMGARVRTAALTVALGALVAAVACDGPPEAEAARSPFERLVADSASADSAAFASLPPALDGWLDVREFLTDSARATLPIAQCQELEPIDAGLHRRQIRMRMADNTVVVLYAVADRANGALDRVEFIRRTPRNGQRGLVWESARDRTLSTWWNETSWGLSRRVERGEIPRGGPVPRAMRALGRRLFVLPCEAASPEMVPDGR